MASITYCGMYGGGGHQCHGCAIGQHKVDAGGGELARGVKELKSPREWGIQEGGVDIQPSATWTKEMCKKRTDRPTGARGAEEVALRKEGAIEVSHQQGGYLHVEGMQVFLHELLPLFAFRSVSLRFKRGIYGGEQQTVRKIRTWCQADGMPTTVCMEATTGCGGGQHFGQGEAAASEKPDSAGSTM